MSSYFKDSVVLANNISGHAVSANYNKCSISFIRQYFANGTLPTEGTICQPDILPFGLYPNGTIIEESLLDNVTALIGLTKKK